MKKEDVPEQHYHRRATDAIHGLMFETKTVEWKDVLGVVANMNEILVAVANRLDAHSRDVNARLDAQDKDSKSLRDKIDLQGTSQMKLFNTAVTGYRVFSTTVTVAAFIILGMGGYILKTHLDGLIVQIVRTDRLEARLQTVETSAEVYKTQLTNATGQVIDLTHRLDDIERGFQRPNIVIHPPGKK